MQMFPCWPSPEQQELGHSCACAQVSQESQGTVESQMGSTAAAAWGGKVPECPVGLHPEAAGSGCPAVCVPCVPPAAAEMGLSASLPVPHGVC